MNNARLTKAQLIAKINELEAEIDALYVEQRPSRTFVGALTHDVRTFTANGVAFIKTRPRGGDVWTVKPIRPARAIA